SGEEGGAQSVTLSVTTDNNSLFEKIEIHDEAVVYILKNNVSGSANITVTVTDDGGTVNGGTNTFYRTFTLTVHPLPVTGIASNVRTEASQRTTLFLTASEGTAYQWDVSPGFVDAHNSADKTLRPPQNTTYWVWITEENNS